MQRRIYSVEHTDSNRQYRNAYGRFNGRYRDEFLNEHWFSDLPDVVMKAEAWRVDYNEVRPHSSLGYLTPAGYAAMHGTETEAKLSH